MSTIRLRSAGTVALVGALALSLVGCSGASSATQPSANVTSTSGLPTGLEPQPLSEKTEIVVNLAAMTESFAMVLLADELGEFEKENISVEYTHAPAADALQALATGQVDMTASGITASLFNAVYAGSELRAVMQLYAKDESQGLYLRNELAEAGPEALKGATIASAIGAGGHAALAVNHYLQGGGLDVTDVEFQVFPSADTPAALEAGAVDGAWILFPAGAQVEAAGFAKKVQGVYPDGFAGGAYLFGPRLLEQEPEVGQAVIRAMARTSRDHLQGDYKDDNTVLAALVKALDSTEENVRLTPSLVFEASPTFPLEPMSELQDLWFLNGGLLQYPEDEALDLKKIVDDRFIQAVNG